MGRKRFTPEQIIARLREAEVGLSQNHRFIAMPRVAGQS